MLSSCATIEVAKEVTKASQSIKTSVGNIIDSNQKTNSTDENNKALDQNTNDIKKEIDVMEEEKKNERKKIKEQKKIVRVVFLGQTQEEIKALIGDPKLKRTDGNIQILRFDAKNCRLFLFFNIRTKSETVKYFELRDGYGNLIREKKKIRMCHKMFILN